jgi:hypothetical protein
MSRTIALGWLPCGFVIAFGCGPRDHVGPDLSSADSAATGAAMAPGPVLVLPTAATPAAAGRSSSNPAAPRPAADGGVVDVARAGAGDAGATPAPSDAPAQGDASTESPVAPATGPSGEQAGSAADGAGHRAEDPACDLNGIWIARLTTFSRDSVFGAVQTASNWFYYEISQDGRAVTISRELDCGLQVSGSSDVTINAVTTQALLHRNDQSGRSGQFYADGDHCTFTLARFYSTRGVPRATFLPADTSSDPELSTLTPMLPTEQAPSGAEDWDNDGYPGIAINVAGLGSRHVVQRDWNEFSSDPTAPIAAHASEFTASANFDVQEQILAVSGGLGALLRAEATPAVDMHHRVTFRHLGNSTAEAAVAAIRVSDDLQTCFNVQDALPHDSAMQ